MKKLTLIFTLLFSTIMFSSPSYAKWTKVNENESGNTIYVDFEKIRKHGGYVYWWQLVDLLKPDAERRLSYTDYFQGDCKLFRFKTLSENHYNRPMGRGTVQTITPNNPKWDYPPPNSVLETALKQVCSR